MKINSVVISRTFNLGNFNSLKVEMGAELSEKDDPQDVAEDLLKEIQKTKDAFEAD